MNEKKIFFGWWVILACAVVALGSSCARYMFGMFMPFMLKDLGWTRAAISGAFTVHMIVYAVGALFVGRWTDKYGARWIMALGGIVLLAGIALLSSVQDIWQFYAFYGVVAAIGVTMTYFVPNLSTARKWFIKRAGLAVAIVSMGSGLGMAVISPVAPLLILPFGWRTSYLILGVIIGVVIFLSSIAFVRKTPESIGLYPDGVLPGAEKSQQGTPQPVVVNEAVWTVKEALKTRPVWIMMFIYPFSLVGVFGLIAHMGAWGGDIAKTLGLSLKQVAPTVGLSMMVMGLVGSASRLVSGHLSDIFGRKPLLYATFILQSLSYLYAILYVNNMTTFVIFAVAIGFSYGLNMSLWVPFLGDIYGRHAVATLWGIMTFSLGMISGLAPLLFGWVHDRTGSYDNAFYFSIFLLILCIFLTAIIRPIAKK